MKWKRSPVEPRTNKAAYGRGAILLQPHRAINRNESIEYLVIVTTSEMPNVNRVKGTNGKNVQCSLPECPVC